MKRTNLLPLLFTGLAVFLFSNVKAQDNPCCPNLGFEQGNFTNWTGYTGTVGSSTGVITWNPAGLSQGPNNALPTPGLTNAPSHFINNVQGLDPNCWVANPCANASCMTRIAPGGGTTSVRLGNATNGYGAEKLEYSLKVQPCNTAFTYSFAVIFEDPSHTPTQQPSFLAQVLDSTGALIHPICAQYSVVASANDPNFYSNPAACAGANTSIRYRCWVTVGMDLAPYLGKTITLSFSTKDCALGGHYGYGYIDANCGILTAQAYYCPGQIGQIALVAPANYAAYQWFYPNGQPVPAPQGINDTCIIPSTGLNPGDTFTVQLSSTFNLACQTVLQVVLVPSQLQAVTSATSLTCFGSGNGTASITPSNGIANWTVQFYNMGGSLLQQNVIGSVSTVTMDSLAAGSYPVFIKDSLGCSYWDTITVTQPPAPTDTTLPVTYFCNGDSMMLLIAPTGFSANGAYSWTSYPNGGQLNPPQYIGDNNDTMIVFNPTPGNSYYLNYTINAQFNCKRNAIIQIVHGSTPYINPDSTANVFTPNGDGMNDLFYPLSNPTIGTSYFSYYAKEFSLKIYNRWGKLMYETDDYNQPWNGKNKGDGKDCADGVYYWIATYKNRCAPESDPPVEQKGFVHLFN